MTFHIKGNNARKWLQPFSKKGQKSKISADKITLTHTHTESVRTLSTAPDASATWNDSSTLNGEKETETTCTSPPPTPGLTCPLSTTQHKFSSANENQQESRDEDEHGDISQKIPITNTFSKFSEGESDQYDYGDVSQDGGAKYGHGEASPDDLAKYGYGDCSPDQTCAFSPSRTPRRSSMKVSSRPLCNRRASIGEVAHFKLPGHEGPVRRRRSISFEEGVAVKTIEAAKFLAEDPTTLWFQENEYNMIKSKMKAVLNKVNLEENCLAGGKKYCTRGLERYMTPEVTKLKQRQAWDNVLIEQSFQRQEGEFDDEQIAEMYKASTVRTQAEAATRANLDAAEAAAYLKATRKRYRRMSM